MWRKEKRRLAQEEDELHDIEGNPRDGAFQNNKKKKKEVLAEDEIAVVVQTAASL